MVFYRKYRPQTINDLDSAAVRETLTSVLQNLPAGRQEDVPHAFLFTGPKGLGKTSAARILAKVVNCEFRGKGKGDKGQESIEPCNQCDQCVAITNGTSLDILEIDAASNRGIDEIRDLKEKIRLSPVSSQKKVYIIDEVHMLTTEAFNALLKTLEEPPEHAMFILCTTEPQKVPSTILSRCFHISFLLATPDELVRSFKRIVLGEKADVDDDALLMIARLADGGFRDGSKILEEMMTLSGGKKVTTALVEEKYKVSGISYLVSRMIEVFSKRDTKKGLEIVSQLIEQGVDIKYFLQQLMEELHTSLLLQIGDPKKKEVLSVGEITALFELLTKAYGEMKYAVLLQLPLELVIIAWGQGTRDKGQGGVMTDDGVSVSGLRKQVVDKKRQEALYGVPPAKESSVSEDISIKTTTVELRHTTGTGDVTREWLEHFWKTLISEMKAHNHTIAGVLRGCRIKSYSKEVLVIEAAYKFHKERLDEIKTRDALHKITKALTGNDVEIKVELRK